MTTTTSSSKIRRPPASRPVDIRSGYYSGAYRELRDEKVAFFLRDLPQGKQTLSHRLRAEIPGKFSALPAKIAAMHAGIAREFG